MRRPLTYYTNLFTPYSSSPIFRWAVKRAINGLGDLWGGLGLHRPRAFSTVKAKKGSLVRRCAIGKWAGFYIKGTKTHPVIGLNEPFLMQYILCLREVIAHEIIHAYLEILGLHAPHRLWGKPLGKLINDCAFKYCNGLMDIHKIKNRLKIETGLILEK
jgi:hypothetical protein